MVKILLFGFQIIETKLKKTLIRGNRQFYVVQIKTNPNMSIFALSATRAWCSVCHNLIYSKVSLSGLLFLPFSIIYDLPSSPFFQITVISCDLSS